MCMQCLLFLYQNCNGSLARVRDQLKLNENDKVIADGIGWNSSSSYSLTVDNRHLFVYDTISGQQVYAIDWQAPENKIEQRYLGYYLKGLFIEIVSIIEKDNLDVKVVSRPAA